MSRKPPYDDFNGQYIDGSWRSGQTGKSLSNHNPFDGSVIGEITLASKADLDAAYKAAAQAQKSWAASLHSERTALFLRVLSILDARKDEIIGWLVREAGSTLLKATLEWGAVRAGTLEAMALPSRVAGRIMPIDVPGKQSFVYREPLGVVGVISPWNFPMHLSHRSIAPALALGNAVVVKPADDTPVTGGLLLAKIYEEAGLPPGLLNIVIGDVADIGDAFSLHPIPKLISFTGSTRVGKQIAALAATGPHLKHVGLELGGNAPIVVLDDADLELAVRAAAFARFLHNGQICMSGNRIIVDARVHDAFLERFVAHVRTFKTGDPADPATVIGPLMNARQKAAALRSIAGARDAGFAAQLSGEADGLLVPPHIFSGVTNDSTLAQAEQFAPIAPIIKAADEAEALRFANATEFGLSSAVFTQDVARGIRFARRVEAGMTHVNDISVQDSPFNMFGGEKNSGIGRFNGDWIISELTTDHWITVQDTPRQYPF
ncbi:aldehyde dehydrogenase family protein [Novosphingobium resinovorum]|uniref:aldehyde dehydrogenase family protein n=1 Tax=Novosphingobium resinovorum TaxID=158500 RepID=UPI002ED2FEF4|nr:aldehyde dehydrogenase family protein [Novosphingobium resinovorum]